MFVPMPGTAVLPVLEHANAMPHVQEWYSRKRSPQLTMRTCLCKLQALWTLRKHRTRDVPSALLPEAYRGKEESFLSKRPYLVS